MKTRKLTTILFILIIFSVQGQVSSQFRGPNRDGIYPETNLLKTWPENGPELLWYNDSLPTGYSSPAVDVDAIYLTGLADTMDYLFALDTTGKLLWNIPFGKAWMNSFSDSRCSPTIDGDNLYVSSGYLDLACVNKKTGKIIWKMDAFKMYQGRCGDWGYAESPLIVADKVFITPGGDQTTMVALNKLTGEQIWASESLKDATGYVSPICIHENGKDIIVTVLAHYVAGFDANTGAVLFKTDYSKIGSEKAFAIWSDAALINTNTPIYNYKDRELYVTSGYNHSGVKFKLSDDLSNLKVIWVDSVLDVHHGATVVVDGYIYGANWINNSDGNWCCIDWNTGACKWETKWKNKGSIISADGMLYCYEEKHGNIALVKPNPEKFEIVSTFRAPKGKGPYWPHLVINKGKLYVRHGNALMVYDIAKK